MSTVPKGSTLQIQSGLKPPAARPPPPAPEISPEQMRTVYNRGYAPNPIAATSASQQLSASQIAGISPTPVSIGGAASSTLTSGSSSQNEQPVIDALNTALQQNPWLTQDLALSILQQAIASGLPVSQQVAAVNAAVVNIGPGSTSPLWPTTPATMDKQVATYTNINPQTGQVVKGGNFFSGYQIEQVPNPNVAPISNSNQPWSSLANSLFAVVRPAIPPPVQSGPPPPPSGILNVQGPGFGFNITDPTTIQALNAAIKSGNVQVQGNSVVYGGTSSAFGTTGQITLITLPNAALAQAAAAALLSNQGVTYTTSPAFAGSSGNASQQSASGNAGLSLLNSIANAVSSGNVSVTAIQPAGSQVGLPTYAGGKVATVNPWGPQPQGTTYVITVGTQQYKFSDQQAAYNFYATLNPSSYSINLGGRTVSYPSQSAAQQALIDYYQGQIQPFTNPVGAATATNPNAKTGTYGFTVNIGGTNYYFPNMQAANSFISNYAKGNPVSGYSIAGSSLVFPDQATATQYAQGIALAAIQQTGQGPWGQSAYTVKLGGQSYVFQNYNDAAAIVKAAYTAGSKGVSIATAPNGVSFIVDSTTGTSSAYQNYLATYYGNQLTTIASGVAGNQSGQNIYQVNINGNVYRFSSQKEANSVISQLVNGQSVNLVQGADGSYQTLTLASLLNPNQPIIITAPGKTPYASNIVSGYLNGVLMTQNQILGYNNAQIQSQYLTSQAGNTIAAKEFTRNIPANSALWQGQDVSSLYSFIQQHPDATLVVGPNGSVTVSQAYLSALQAQNQLQLQTISNQINQSLVNNQGVINPSDIKGIQGVTGVTTMPGSAFFAPSYTIQTQYGDITVRGGKAQQLTEPALASLPPVTPTYGILNPAVRAGNDIIGGLMSGFNSVVRDINSNPVGRAVTGQISKVASEAGPILGTLNTPGYKLLGLSSLRPPSPSTLLSDSNKFFNSFFSTGGKLTGEYIVPGLTKTGAYVAAGPAALVAIARGQNPASVIQYGLGNQPSTQAKQVLGTTLFESFLVGAGIGFAPGVAGITIGRTALGAGSMLALNTALAPAPTPQYQRLLNQNQSLQNQLNGLQTQISSVQTQLSSTSPSSASYVTTSNKLNNLVNQYNDLANEQQNVQQALQQAQYQGFGYSNLPALLQGKSPLPYAAANFNAQSLLASLGMGVGFTYAFAPLSGVLGAGAKGVSGAARRVATGGLVNVGLSVPMTAAQGQNPFNVGGLLYNFGLGAGLGATFEAAPAVPRAVRGIGDYFVDPTMDYLRGTNVGILSELNAPPAIARVRSVGARVTGYGGDAVSVIKNYITRTQPPNTLSSLQREYSIQNVGDALASLSKESPFTQFQKGLELQGTNSFGRYLTSHNAEARAAGLRTLRTSGISTGEEVYPGVVKSNAVSTVGTDISIVKPHSEGVVASVRPTKGAETIDLTNEASRFVESSNPLIDKIYGFNSAQSWSQLLGIVSHESIHGAMGNILNENTLPGGGVNELADFAQNAYDFLDYGRYLNTKNTTGREVAGADVSGAGGISRVGTLRTPTTGIGDSAMRLFGRFFNVLENPTPEIASEYAAKRGGVDYGSGTFASDFGIYGQRGGINDYGANFSRFFNSFNISLNTPIPESLLGEGSAPRISGRSIPRGVNENYSPFAQFWEGRAFEQMQGEPAAGFIRGSRISRGVIPAEESGVTPFSEFMIGTQRILDSLTLPAARIRGASIGRGVTPYESQLNAAFWSNFTDEEFQALRDAVGARGLKSLEPSADSSNQALYKYDYRTSQWKVNTQALADLKETLSRTGGDITTQEINSIATKIQSATKGLGRLTNLDLTAEAKNNVLSGVIPLQDIERLSLGGKGTPSPEEASQLSVVDFNSLVSKTLSRTRPSSQMTFRKFDEPSSKGSGGTEVKSGAQKLITKQQTKVVQVPKTIQEQKPVQEPKTTQENQAKTDLSQALPRRRVQIPYYEYQYLTRPRTSTNQASFLQGFQSLISGFGQVQSLRQTQTTRQSLAQAVQQERAQTARVSPLQAFFQSFAQIQGVGVQPRFGTITEQQYGQAQQYRYGQAQQYAFVPEYVFGQSLAQGFLQQFHTQQVSQSEYAQVPEFDQTQVYQPQFSWMYQWPTPERLKPPSTLPIPRPTSRSGGPSPVSPVRGYGYGLLRHRLSYNILADLGGVVSNFISNSQPTSRPIQLNTPASPRRQRAVVSAVTTAARPSPATSTSSPTRAQNFRAVQTRMMTRGGGGFKDPGTVFNKAVFSIGRSVKSGSGFMDPGIVSGVSSFGVTRTRRMGSTFQDPNLAKIKTGFQIIKTVKTDLKSRTSPFASGGVVKMGSVFKNSGTPSGTSVFGTVGKAVSNDTTLNLLFGVKKN